MSRSTTQAKRAREQRRLERGAAKQQARAERKVQKAARPRAEDGVDPDIAHIIPGEQPRPADDE